MDYKISRVGSEKKDFENYNEIIKVESSYLEPTFNYNKDKISSLTDDSLDNNYIDNRINNTIENEEYSEINSLEKKNKFIDYNDNDYPESSDLSTQIEYSNESNEKDEKKYISANYEEINKIEKNKKYENYSISAGKKTLNSLNNEFEKYTYNKLEKFKNESTSYINRKENKITPLKVLLSQEPDFFQNMYNVYILFSSSKNNEYSSNVETSVPISDKYTTIDLFERYWLNTPKDTWSMFGLRCEGIEFPQKKQTSSNITFHGQIIPKVLGKVEKQNKGNLNIALDQDMFMLDSFNNLSNFISENKYKSLFNTSDSIGNHDIVKDSFLNMGKTSYKDIYKINIIVEYLSNYMLFTSDTNKQNDLRIKSTPLDKGVVQRYAFCDCRFLGRSSTISFKNDSSEPIKITIPFTFKRNVRLTETIFNDINNKKDLLKALEEDIEENTETKK